MLKRAHHDTVSPLQPKVGFMQQFLPRASGWVLGKVGDIGLDLEDLKKLNLPSTALSFPISAPISPP